MATYERELLDTARLLLTRQPGQKGKLPSARIRRSISTAYYALFHFLLDQAAKSLVGSTNNVSRRRRVLARVFAHTGVNATLEKVRGAQVHDSVSVFMRFGVDAVGPVACPTFVRDMASAFADAHTFRQDADYDRNKPIFAENATQLIERVEQAMFGWSVANTASERDFKHALCMLMLLKGQLRRGD